MSLVFMSSEVFEVLLALFDIAMVMNAGTSHFFYSVKLCTMVVQLSQNCIWEFWMDITALFVMAKISSFLENY